MKTMTMTIRFSKALSVAFLLAVCALVSSKARAITTSTQQRIPNEQPPIVAPLDDKRLFALGMIETGNNDRAIGLAGEVSRYQLSPRVWKTYSKNFEFWKPERSTSVARQHWNYLAEYFKSKSGRPPTDFDMYVLWNTRYGYYEHKSFSRQRISAVVEERAQRFVNLVNRKD